MIKLSFSEAIDINSITNLINKNIKSLDQTLSFPSKQFVDVWISSDHLGKDKRIYVCKIKIHIPKLKVLNIEKRDENLSSAIKKCFSVAKKTINRTLGKRTDNRNAA